MRILAVVTFLIPLIFALPSRSHAQDVIGTPCADKGWYARNIWDMVAYGGGIYAGCGNSSNSGPMPNAGPVDIWKYQDGIGWINEDTIPEEQIDSFVVINGMLTVPGHDPMVTGDYATWYVLGSQGWQQHRDIPDTLHLYDFKEYKGILFAGLGSLDGHSVAVSTDGGKSWKRQLVPFNGQINYDVCLPDQFSHASRVFQFFVVADNFYANLNQSHEWRCANTFWTDMGLHRFARWNGRNFELSDVDFFAGQTADRVVRSVQFGTHTIYIAANTVNDHQWIPVSLMSVDAKLKPEPIHFANCDRPQDIKTVAARLFVLCNQETNSGWHVSIRATCDLTQWVTISEFDEPTFARSFVLNGMESYFGLGTDDTTTDEVARDATGMILRETVPPINPC